MNDCNDIIYQIEDLLGDGGSHELAEAVYAELVDDGRVYWDDTRGYVLRDGVDLIEIAARHLH